MYFDGAFLQLGKCDVRALRERVAAIEERAWEEDGRRQRVHSAHIHTQSICLLAEADLAHSPAIAAPLFDDFADLLAPIMASIEAFYAGRACVREGDGAAKPGYFCRALLVRLNAGGEIFSHTDQGYSLSRAHRIHVPIVTSERTLFAVAGVIKHLAAGEIWEINNRKPHAVRNMGPTRIHAVLDYVLPGEVVHDPDGLLHA